MLSLPNDLKISLCFRGKRTKHRLVFEEESDGFGECVRTSFKTKGMPKVDELCDQGWTAMLNRDCML